MKNINFLLLTISTFVFATLTLQCTFPVGTTQISNPKKDKPEQFIKTIKYYKVDVNMGAKTHHYAYQYHANGNLKESLTMSGENEKIIEKYNAEGQRILEEILEKKALTFLLNWIG